MKYYDTYRISKKRAQSARFFDNLTAQVILEASVRQSQSQCRHQS